MTETRRVTPEQRTTYVLVALLAFAVAFAIYGTERFGSIVAVIPVILVGAFAVMKALAKGHLEA